MDTPKNEPGNRTSEFWLTILTAILGVLKATVLPDLPEESFYAVMTYIGARTAGKMVKK